MNSYRGSRKYVSELGISTDIMDILPTTLTLYPELHPVIFRKTKDSELKTIFHEVDILPFDEANPHAEKQLQPLEDIEKVQVSEEHYAAIMWETLQKAILDLWKPGAKHIAFTSSGYDSRLIAFAIMKLLKEHGREWLGDIIFIECDGEGEQFRVSMDMIGWSQDRCFVYNEGAPVHEYHANSFDFETAWEKLGGMSGFPLSMRWEAEKWLQGRGLMPTDGDVQVIGGYFSNEIVTTMLKDMTLYDYFKSTYRRAISTPRAWLGSPQSPFQHFDMITNQLKYGKEHLIARTGMAQLILKHFAPTQLAELPSPKHKTKTVRYISERLLDKAIHDYSGSWFGKRFEDVVPTRQVWYDPWWAHWCVASFCEHLIREGHEISIKEKAL